MSNITTQRVRELCDEQGRSLKFLCDKIGVKSRTYFHDIEKHGREIPSDKLSLIAEALDTSVDYLLGNTDVKKDTSLLDRFNALVEASSPEQLLAFRDRLNEIFKNDND